MAERIHHVLKDKLTNKNLARLFNYGGIICCQKDGTIGVIPQADLEIEVQPPGSDEWAPVSLPRWKPSGEDLNPVELILVAGNFGQGLQGKHDRNTWRKDNFTTENAPTRRGYAVTGGHRGGMRQANSWPVLRKLLNLSPRMRKYR